MIDVAGRILRLGCLVWWLAAMTTRVATFAAEVQTLQEKDVLPLLVAAQNAWDNKANGVGNLSGTARLRFPFRGRQCALEVRFWSREPFYRADIFEGGRRLASIVDTKEFSIYYVLVQHLRTIPSNAPFPENSVIIPAHETPDPLVQILPPAQKTQLSPYQGIDGLNVLITPDTMFKRMANFYAACIRDISRDAVAPHERLTLAFPKLERHGDRLLLHYVANAQNRPAPSGENYVLFRMEREMEIDLTAEFALLKSRVRSRQESSEARGKPVIFTVDINSESEYRYADTPVGTTPVFQSELGQVEGENGVMIQNDNWGMELSDLSFAPISDAVFTLSGMDIAVNTMVRNEITETYFRYRSDSQEEALLQQLLSLSMRDTPVPSVPGPNVPMEADGERLPIASAPILGPVEMAAPTEPVDVIPPPGESVAASSGGWTVTLLVAAAFAFLAVGVGLRRSRHSTAKRSPPMGRNPE